ncbi:MAG: AAA family ATPase, partial [Gammaproteobacteria bacterium]
MSLESLPFENIPDPEYFFDLSYYGRVLSQMMDRLWSGRSLVLVSGPTVTEKSIFLRRLKACVPEKTRILWLERPPDTGDALLLFLTKELRINLESTDRVAVLSDIKAHLLTLHDEGYRCLVVMENAHDMNDDVLECVRLLNNLEKSSMYTNHFSLESLPFENVPDPAYFFDQGDYSRVLSRMKDSLRAGRGLMVVAGPIGTGKTTLSQKLMISVPQQTKIIWLGEPPDTSDDLLLFLTHELNIKPEMSGRVFVLRDIKEYLQKLNKEGNRCLVIIDDQH